jgi:hypothetical protein
LEDIEEGEASPASTNFSETGNDPVYHYKSTSLSLVKCASGDGTNHNGPGRSVVAQIANSFYFVVDRCYSAWVLVCWLGA